MRTTVPSAVRPDVSPDVVFAAIPSLFSPDDKVDVPWAQTVVNEVPESTVGVSSDGVVLDKNPKPINRQGAGIPINNNLMIHIDNSVRLEVFDLKACLTGDLEVMQDKQNLGLNGQIDIPDGRFHACGRDLIVRKGELLLFGPPDQPLLNIEVTRNPGVIEDDVIASVRVAGSVDQPKAEIFSDLVISQQEALSYLLHDQGLSSGRSGSAAMTSVLIGMEVTQSGQVVGKTGEVSDAGNLVLDTEEVGNSSQVAVSSYVLPGLQVKYGVDIFDSLAVLVLYYRLMPRLCTETVSGINQVLDLSYQSEFQ